MSERTRLLAVCAVLLLVSVSGSCPCSAAESAAARKPACVWLSLGPGLGTPGGLAGGVSLHYLTPSDHILCLRAAGTTPAPFGHGDDSSDIGILYGWASRSRSLIRSFAVGLSSAHASHHEDGWGWLASTEGRTTLGVPLEGQLIWTPTPVVGFGLTAFGDLNPRQSSAGLLFSLHLGKLR